MLYAYLFSAIVGAILMGVSLFGSGGDHDADGDGLADADVGSGHDAHGGHHVHGVLSAASALISLRVWTYVLLFGGLAGLALRAVAHLAEPWAALTALLSGTGAAALSRALLRRAVDRPSVGGVNTGALVGRSARVLVPFDQSTTGKVRIQVNESTLDVLATTDDVKLGAQDEVLIVEVRGGTTAHVTRNPISARPDASGRPPRA